MKKEKTKKRNIGNQIKTYSVIVNLIVAIFAFAFMLGMSVESVDGLIPGLSKSTYDKKLKECLNYCESGGVGGFYTIWGDYAQYFFKTSEGIVGTATKSEVENCKVNCRKDFDYSEKPAKKTKKKSTKRVIPGKKKKVITPTDTDLQSCYNKCEVGNTKCRNSYEIPPHYTDADCEKILNQCNTECNNKYKTEKTQYDDLSKCLVGCEKISDKGKKDSCVAGCKKKYGAASKKPTTDDEKKKCKENCDKTYPKNEEKQRACYKSKCGVEQGFFSGLGEILLHGGKIGLGTMGVAQMIFPILGIDEGKNGKLHQFMAGFLGGVTQKTLMKVWGVDKYAAGTAGAVVGLIYFIAAYTKESSETAEFQCLPWEAPIGGDDCELCNDFEECSEYVCKSLGQACELINKGTEEQKCVWKNPQDVNSPKISLGEIVTRGYLYMPDEKIRPPATGIRVYSEEADRSVCEEMEELNAGERKDCCVEPYTPLEFTIENDEPAQCKIDYTLKDTFDEMSYFMGGSNLMNYNHTERLSLPGPDAIENSAPGIKNNGIYTLYIRCRDANGNFNQDFYSVRFCVKPGPDATAPRIEDLSIPSGSPVAYEQLTTNFTIYTNEPAECRWDFRDQAYERMSEDNQVECGRNNRIDLRGYYICEQMVLNQIQDMKENLYYIRCRDQPSWYGLYSDVSETDRNSNVQSYLYKVIGTQPLNILEASPNDEIVRGSTDTIPVNLEIKTDNGYKNGEATCMYYNDYANEAPTSEESYIAFLDTTKTNIHKQRQDLLAGTYTYFLKCLDEGGNADYTNVSFEVEVDRESPMVLRAYKEGADLKIITNEESECSYSVTDCNFEIDDGIQLNTFDKLVHTIDWKISHNYYIRCRDKYNMNPNPNTCSIIVRPYEVESTGYGSGIIEL